MKPCSDILFTYIKPWIIHPSGRPFPNSGGVVVVFSNCQLPIVNCTSSTFHSKFSVLYSKFSFSQGFLYAPFGEITTEYNANFGYNVLPKYSFNAKELDEETGMYYYEARYYKPPVFTSRDPMMDQKPWLTPYHYCSNNPVGMVDPSGMLDDMPDDPPGKKTSQAKPKIVVNIVPQDNLQQKQVFLPGDNNSTSPKKGLLQRLDELLNSKMTSGNWCTAENGQGQETRKGDGPKTDVSSFTSNIPDAPTRSPDKRAYYDNQYAQESYQSNYLPSAQKNNKTEGTEGYFSGEAKNGTYSVRYPYKGTSDSMRVRGKMKKEELIGIKVHIL